MKLIDILVPKDHRVDGKEKEKINRNQNLKIEIKRLWNMKTIVVLIVIGWLGTISKQFNDHAQRLELDSLSLLDLQKSVLLGTVTHFRKSSSALRNLIES